MVCALSAGVSGSTWASLYSSSVPGCITGWNQLWRIYDFSACPGVIFPGVACLGYCAPGESMAVSPRTTGAHDAPEIISVNCYPNNDDLQPAAKSRPERIAEYLAAAVVLGGFLLFAGYLVAAVLRGSIPPR